jgi:hypothetical protein
MSSDLLSAVLIMASDVNELDSNGLLHFGMTFKENINPPTKISNQVKDGAMSLAGSVCSYIFWTIFIVATVIIISMAYIEIVSWLIGGILIIIIGIVVLIMASLLYNRVYDYTVLASKELNDHVSDYTSGILEDFITALRNGILAYASNRSKEDKMPDIDLDEDIEF